MSNRGFMNLKEQPMGMNKNFSPTESEKEIFERWEKSGAFRAGENAKPGAKSFCIMIPPPNVTGSLHMGHAFNNTLQDILIRWHRMRGFDTLWQPGQDHAGIATQMVVERQLVEEGGPSRSELGREEFLKKIWEWKEKSGDTIIRQLKRLGASCDWERNRFTMDPGFHDAVLKVFIELYNKGLIYRGKRLVNWDPFLETAISDLEVEQIEQAGFLWKFRYKLENGATYEHPIKFDDDNKAVAYETRDYIVVATTRPETMLGDSGVAVNESDERYESLVGKTVILPLVNRSIPIVQDHYADPNKGTGAVKITPAHDFNDWDVGKRNGLRVINVFDTKARVLIEGNKDFLENSAPEKIVFAMDKVDRYDARKTIVSEAEAGGWLEGIDTEQHMVPHGDRSNVAIEPLLTNQWFVDTKQIVQPAINAVKNGKTKILPDQDAKVYFNWLENIEPWCVSRQLWWGHQIPIWYDEDGKEYCAMSETEAALMADGKPLKRDPDVLDTWFSSGLWPIGTLGWPKKTPELSKYFPTSVLVTGFDIIFFWVARMMMMQLAVVNEVPFHTVYVHALVRDEKGKKMSKSKGNVMDPLDLIDEYGTDAVRFTLTAMAAMGRDLKLSNSRIAGYRNFGTKMWNAARFAEMNDCRPVSEFDPTTVKETLNQWIVGETARFKVTFDKALSSYRFNDAASIAYTHVWGKFCDWYVEFSKPLLNLEGSAVRKETQETMAWALDQCLIVLHPLMPFITEELWGAIEDRDKMLIVSDWPEYTEQGLVNTSADNEMEWIISLIEQIRSVKSELGVPAGAKIPLVIIKLEEKFKKVIEKNRILIERLARLSSISFNEEHLRGIVTLTLEGGEFALPISDLIDLPSEKARLFKTIEKTEKEVTMLTAKLANEKFIIKAPETVINEVKIRLDELIKEQKKLSGALDRLKAVES